VVKQFRARNPNQHLMLTEMTNLCMERQKPYSRVAEINMDEGEEDRGRQKKKAGAKRVSWARSLLRVRSISPRVVVPGGAGGRFLPGSGFRFPDSPIVFHRSPSPPAPVTARVSQESAPFDWRIDSGRESREDGDLKMKEDECPDTRTMSNHHSDCGTWRSIPITRLDLSLDLQNIVGEEPRRS